MIVKKQALSLSEDVLSQMLQHMGDNNDDVMTVLKPIEHFAKEKKVIKPARVVFAVSVNTASHIVCHHTLDALTYQFSQSF